MFRKNDFEKMCDHLEASLKQENTASSARSKLPAEKEWNTTWNLQNTTLRCRIL